MNPSDFTCYKTAILMLCNFQHCSIKTDTASLTNSGETILPC